MVDESLFAKPGHFDEATNQSGAASLAFDSVFESGNLDLAI